MKLIRKSGKYIGNCKGCNGILATFDINEGAATCPGCGKQVKVRRSATVRVNLKQAAKGAMRQIRKQIKPEWNAKVRRKAGRWHKRERDIAELWFMTGGTLVNGSRQMDALTKAVK